MLQAILGTRVGVGMCNPVAQASKLVTVLLELAVMLDGVEEDVIDEPAGFETDELREVVTLLLEPNGDRDGEDDTNNEATLEVMVDVDEDLTLEVGDGIIPLAKSFAPQT